MSNKCTACKIWLSQRTHAIKDADRLRHALELAVERLVSFAEDKDDGNAEGYYGSLAEETLEEIGKIMRDTDSQQAIAKAKE